MLFFIKKGGVKKHEKNAALKERRFFLSAICLYYFATASRRLRIEKMKTADTRQIAISTPQTT